MQGILLALYDRTKTNKGQIIDAAMIDGATHLSSFIYRMRASGMWSDEVGEKERKKERKKD